MKGKRVFLYVQHLLGIGHLRRAVTLANALAAAGLEVTLASGGCPVNGLALDGVRFVQLPPARAMDASFRVLVEPDGTPIDETWKSMRQAFLLDAWRDADPHALILELYPFGRRQMRFELVPLLEAATSAVHRPLIVSSVRDVLGGGQTDLARQDGMLEVFERYFDRVLVHADPEIIPFSRTFRHAEKIQARLHYTGYVVDRVRPAPDNSPNGPVGENEVMISAGGGAVGMRLLETALRAMPHSRLAGRTWRVLTGVNASDTSLNTLAAIAEATGEGQIKVERARPDFANLLARCAVSVSQGGYNTVMEIIQAGARAVVVPFAGGAEIEQTLRARSFAARGLIGILEEDALTPESLASAIDQAADRARPSPCALDLNGAERTAALIASWTTDYEW